MNCSILREKLSHIHQVDQDNFVFGNGSFELISLIAQVYLEAGDESIIPVPSFGWYSNVTLQMNANAVNVPLKDYKVDLDKIYQSITEKTKLIWICNPNNPTGTIIEQQNLLEFIKKVRSDILIVLDEAYIDFLESEYLDTTKLIYEYSNIILLRTFSKLYGLASFRIGYGIADEKIIQNLNKVRLPINVNFLAQEAAIASLDDNEFRDKVLINNKIGLQMYYTALEELGLEYVRSNGNFILLNVGKDSLWVENEFLKEGIMIRAAVEFGLPTWIRISVGTVEENVKVIKILKKIMRSNYKTV
jgi:histidinol-phosphate aminotransferase